MTKKSTYILVFIFAHFILNAQQVTSYAQFTMNKFGMNPAASGTNTKVKYEFLAGARRQWLDIDNAPMTNFVSANYNFIPKWSYRKWHNIGLYVDQDQSGVFNNNGIYISYSFHLIISKHLTASFGIFAGVRRFFLSTSSLNKSDPAVAKSSTMVIAYPDIIPGVRLQSKKFFFDLSVRQVTTEFQSGNRRKIGSPSRLFPYIYMDIGRRFALQNAPFYFMPSLSVLSTYNQLPTLGGNVMLFYKDRIGVGLSIRNKSLAGGILQIRFLKNATVGFAYEYSINKMRVAAANTYEIMIGIVPFGGGTDKSPGKNRVADCPALSF